MSKKYIIQINSKGSHNVKDIPSWAWVDYKVIDDRVKAEKKAVEILLELQNKKYIDVQCRVVIECFRTFEDIVLENKKISVCETKGE